MKRTTTTLGECVVFAAVLFVGCNLSDSPAANNTNADVKHDHQHPHGDHEHSHAKEHAHGHRRAEALYGGRIVSIGHSHHADGVTHYHAEVMPIARGRITFHVQVEDERGRSKDFPVESKEIIAFVDRLGAESPRALEVVFRADAESRATYVADIPEDWRESNEKLSVVVPKIKLGGERLSFSFSAEVENVEVEEKPNQPADETPKEPAA